jgi:hypothetical protein
MNRSSAHLRCGDSFRRIESIAQTLPGVEVATKYDGSPVLKVSGRFMAGLATHWSAEPESLVVRCEPDDRTGMIEEAAETYYVTDYYRPHPVVLARLSRLDDGVLRELLAISRKLTLRRASTDHAFE